MATEFFKIINTYLRPNSLTLFPPLQEGKNVCPPPDKFRLIQEHFQWTSKGRKGSWKPTRTYLLFGSNYTYATQLVLRGNTATLQGKSLLNLTDPIESAVSGIIGQFEAHCSKARRSLVLYAESAAEIQTSHGISSLDPKDLSPIRVSQANLSQPLCRAETRALNQLVKCDQQATIIYNAAKKSASFSHFLGALGVILPGLFVLISVQDAFRQLSKDENPTQVTQQLFWNVTLLCSGFGEGLILEGIRLLSAS